VDKNILQKKKPHLHGLSLYISLSLSLSLSLSIKFLCVKITRETDTGTIGYKSLFVNTSSMDLDFPMDECIELPTMDNSQGLWNYIISGPVKFLPLQIIQLEMVVIFGITQASHYVLKRFGIPRFTTQLLVCALFHFLISGLFILFARIYIYLIRLLSWRLFFILTEQVP
jgi:hypothetical protein